MNRLLLALLFVFTLAATAPSPRLVEQVICENQVFDGYTQKLIIEDSGPATKVVRNCTFKNSSLTAIVIRGAQNVLIENSHFENIRTHVTGDGVFAIYFACQGSTCPIRNITVRGNTFVDIGADGMQIGDQNRDIRDVLIENNLFYVTNDDVGENGVDIKGADGPIIVRNNIFHGFRPCENPPQDCSGSAGVGMVVHSGSAAGAPHNVTIEANEFYDNIVGLRVSDGTNITIQGNNFHDNQKEGVQVSGVSNCTHAGNIFTNNGKPPAWDGCVGANPPTFTPAPTNTPGATNTPIATPTNTPTGVPPTATFTPTNTSVVPPTSTLVPSATSVPTSTTQTVILNLGDRITIQSNGCRLRIVSQNNNTIEIRCRP